MDNAQNPAGPVLTAAESRRRVLHNMCSSLLYNLSVILFGLLLPRLGMFIAMPVLVLVSAKAGHEFKFLPTLVVAIILTVGSYLIFNLGLNLTIPLWPSFGPLAG